MPRFADYLLIDISNSFTKLAFASLDRIGRADRIETERLTSSVLRRYLRQRDVKTIVVASVMPERNREIRKAARARTRILWIGPRIELGLRIDYPRPSTIGADRLANAAAIAALYGTPGIVVDFGTAVTFDIVAKNRSYIGGVICPGLEAMTNFLYQRTALLPRLSLRGTETGGWKIDHGSDAGGRGFGYRGLVREIIDRIREQEFGGKKPAVIATGGYAGLIARKLPAIDRVDPILTLEGLRIVANLNR